MEKLGEGMRKSNYEIMKEKMQIEFLKYDQDNMIQKFLLKSDDQYLYIRFVGRWYRIHRHSGKVEYQTGHDFHEAGYNEAMSIFDVLCNSKENCCLSGQFATINSLPGTVYGSGPGRSLFQETAEHFGKRPQDLAYACEMLGGIKEKKGDISYRLQIFDFLPVWLQFWEADDEFPVKLQFLWDKNILDYMHYETTFFATGHLLERIRNIADSRGKMK